MTATLETMNKSELVNEVHSLLNSDGCEGDKCCTKACAERALSAVLDAITRGLRQDGTVQIVGFGTFSVATRGARMGVNPRTGDKIQIKESKNIRFKSGAKLKEIL